MLLSGSFSLSALQEQGMTLKKAQRRIMDILNTLGLSNTVMRLIERRSHQDKILFWVLVAVTLILFWGIWRLFH
uniref:Complex I-49kD n=2 Tax=Schistosoma mansoni TaxID=6183 RepID=A0A5K4FDI7_SCHMA